MNKTIYNTAFDLLSLQETACQSFEKSGLRFEYGDGPVGEFLLGLLNGADMIIKESLGLHSNQYPVKVFIGGNEYPTNVDILYSEDQNADWSITEDDFCEFIYKARDDKTVRELMWKAMVDRDQSAKDEYNKLKIGKIGGYDFMHK